MTTKNKVKSSVKVAAAKPGVQPLGDRVYVKLLSPEESARKLPSGLIIPDGAEKEDTRRGKVLAVGPGKRGDDNELVPVGVKVGDKVLFSKYGGEEVEKDHFLVLEQNLLAVIND